MFKISTGPSNKWPTQDDAQWPKKPLLQFRTSRKNCSSCLTFLAMHNLHSNFPLSIAFRNWLRLYSTVRDALFVEYCSFQGPLKNTTAIFFLCLTRSSDEMMRDERSAELTKRKNKTHFSGKFFKKAHSACFFCEFWHFASTPQRFWTLRELARTRANSRERNYRVKSTTSDNERQRATFGDKNPLHRTLRSNSRIFFNRAPKAKDKQTTVWRWQWCDERKTLLIIFLLAYNNTCHHVECPQASK